MNARMWNRRYWVRRQAFAPADFTAMLTAAGFTILETVDHRFTPQGFTLLHLLAESHFALHTFPESGWDYIELTSCNEAMLLAFEKDFLARAETRNAHVRRLDPGERFETAPS
jgi:S-adenosylmethionine decarboxylase